MKKWTIYICWIAVMFVCTNCSSSDEKTIERPLERPPERQLQLESEMVPSYPAKIIAMRKSKEKKFAEGIVPARLYIPSIDVHANIEPVSISSNGQMGVPHHTDDVGYLMNGVLPGSVGNAVMDGHVDNYTGPAVFFRLKTLKKGDTIIVKNEKGHPIEFKVESVDIYKTSEAPIGKIFGPANEPRLNLITCAGKYSRKKREHEARLVVFAKRVTEEP